MGGLLAKTQVHLEIHRPDGRVAESAPLARQYRPLTVALHDQNHRLHHHLPYHGWRLVVCRRQPDLPFRPDRNLQLLRLLRLRLLHHVAK